MYILEKQYEDDFISSESDHMKKGSKVETGSEESEVEEEISGISNLPEQLVSFVIVYQGKMLLWYREDTFQS